MSAEKRAKEHIGGSVDRSLSLNLEQKGGEESQALVYELGREW